MAALAGFLAEPRGRARHDRARARDDPVHRRDRERPRRRGLLGLRRREACAARAGAELSRANSGRRASMSPMSSSTARSTAPSSAASCRTPPKSSRARRFSFPTRSPGTTSGCIGRSGSAWTFEMDLQTLVGDMVMSATIEFIFDFASPNAYLAYRALPPILERTGARLEINPCLLGGIFKATGNQAPIVAFAPDQGQARVRDARDPPLRRQAQARQVPPEPAFPVNSLTLMRGLIAAREAGSRSRLCRDGPQGHVGGGPQARRSGGSGAADRCGRARFEEPHRGGADGPRSSTGSPTTPRLRSRAACSGSRPSSSAQEMFFGKDRLGEVEEALEAAKAQASS